VSRGYDSGTAANGWSDSPDISSDGRLVVYRSIASNIVSGDSNELPDIFVYDRVTTSNGVLTASVSGSITANNWPMFVTFTLDGRSLVLSSWASDMNRQDLNQYGDISVSDCCLPILVTWEWPGAGYRLACRAGPELWCSVQG